MIVGIGSNAGYFSGGPLGVASIWGAAVALAVWMFRRTSGAHFNPAITLALIAKGAAPASEFAPYTFAQCFGALAASVACAFGRTRTLGAAVTLPAPVVALSSEVCVTSVLVVCVFAIGEGVQRGRLPYTTAPAVVGLVITALNLVFSHLAVGLNPAIALGGRLADALLSVDVFRPSWILDMASAPLVGPLLGALLGVYLFRAPSTIHRSANGDFLCNVPIRSTTNSNS